MRVSPLFHSKVNRDTLDRALRAFDANVANLETIEPLPHCAWDPVRSRARGSSTNPRRSILTD